ncbi:MAG: tetratricopeptide repeat protein [Candidatus Eiseniibacteriota bacterium]
MVKTAAFAVAAVALFFALLEGVLALAGVRPGARDEDPFVGFAGRLPLFVERDEGVMETARGKLSWFNPQEFPREKPDGVFRVFAVGGSTTWAQPWGDEGSFCAWLRELLPACDPTRRWEVINAGGISYASYREALVLEELCRYQPDLFIVSSGHNEFLERRTYSELLDTPVAFREAGAFLDRTRVYTAMRRLLGRTGAAAPRRDVLPVEVDALLDRSIGPEDYVRDDTERVRVLNHFRFNLERMVRAARAAGAEIVLVTPAVNLRGTAPFKSEPSAGLTEADAVRFAVLTTAAEAARSEERPDDAAAALEEAVRIDPRHASTQFRLGTVLYALGRHDESRAAFVRALVEDVCPLRALPDMVEIVRDVGARAGAPVADFAAAVERASPHGIPGNELFVDHVHVSVRGNGLVARTILESLVDRGIVRPGPDWSPAIFEETAAVIESRVDPGDQARALANLARLIGWAGKAEEGYELALRALAAEPGNADAAGLAAAFAHRLGRSVDARKWAEETIRLDPQSAKAHDVLGLVLVEAGEVEAGIEHHRESIRLEPESADSRNNLGLALTRAGRLSEALAACDEAIRLRPDFAEAHNNRGIALARIGRAEEAMAAFHEALRLRAEYPQARNNLGLVLAGMGRYAEAAAEFEAALRIRPDYWEARRNLEAARARGG